MNFSNVSVNGNIKPPRSGAFEIILNNKLIFSKFEMNRFPTEKEIGNW
jgi:selT/selW/selH-like putative selenoprotein